MSTSTSSGARSRTYRLSPMDRTGLMFGMSFPQLLLVSGGVVVGSTLMLTYSVPVGVVVLVIGTAVGAVRIQGASMMELAPHVLRYMGQSSRRNRSWFQLVPILGGSDAPTPVFADQDVIVVDAEAVGAGPPGQRIAISRDLKGGTHAATIRVAGRQFSLTDRGEQDWMVAQWGTALQAFIAERTPVVSIRWSEWAAPAGLEEHRSWLRDHLDANPLDDVRTAYERLLAESGSKATRHEVLVTVTIAAGRVKGSRRHDGNRMRAAVDLLLTETRLFTQRLEGAGLVVSAPLGPGEWARAVRLRLDPSCRARLDARQRSLADAAGQVSVANALPAAVESTWTAWRTDDVWHRALYVAEWPRLDVQAAWMSDLMLYNGAVRTISVFFEPVSRSRSQRSITRDAAKLESDAEQRTQKGFRVGAHHRRAARAVEEREAELVAGYGEFLYAGIICITAPTLADIDTASEEISQVAASVGIEVRPLHGRHDQAVAATLPLARGLAPKGSR